MSYSNKFLNKEVMIKIDRPLGTKHPKYDFIYTVNYGFVPKTTAPDGEEIDAYLLGVNEVKEKYTGICIAIIHRKNDDDDKLIIVPKNIQYTNEEIYKQINFQEKFFESEIIR